MAPSQTLKWVETGKNPSRQNVEIEGTEPYIVGGHTASGYWVDTNRETTIHGLFAAGDVAGGCPQKYVTGALVEGEIAALRMVEQLDAESRAEDEAQESELVAVAALEDKAAEYDAILQREHALFTVEQLEEAMQKVMDQYAGGIGTHYQFNGKQLAMAEEKIRQLQVLAEGLKAEDMHELMFVYELKERLTVCLSVIAHLGARKETRWHSFAENLDYPQKSDEWLRYVNSRLVSRGIPVSCEVDVYGALSEYIGMCASGDTVTLLDINNSVPQYIYDEDIAGKFDYSLTDTFMGFHCGNTPACKMCNDRAVKYQLIQHRLLEPAGSDPDFTRGTLEGDIAPSDITFYRLQCDSEGNLRSYIAEGEILPVATRSFGGIAIFGIHEMGRFYRHVLVQKRYPHHGAVAFGHYGKILFEVLKFLGIQDIAYNQPKSLPYPTENPFA